MSTIDLHPYTNNLNKEISTIAKTKLIVNNQNASLFLFVDVSHLIHGRKQLSRLRCMQSGKMDMADVGEKTFYYHKTISMVSCFLFTVHVHVIIRCLFL